MQRWGGLWRCAGDAVSEAMLRTLRVRDLESLEHPAAYLMWVMLNVARSRGRRRNRERTALARLSPPSASELVVRAKSSALTEAVMRLPVQQRAAVYLVYWEDLAQAWTKTR